MLNKNTKIFIILTLFITLTVIFIAAKNNKAKNKLPRSDINPSISDIQVAVATTGIVEPQNRLEIKPPISGRIEEVLVREGDKVKRGTILAWMSSTERAALLDAARAQGEEKVKYWEDVYKATPLMSPIEGEVIVRAVEPGQTVTSADPVIVLSDRLIISAQFDEIDIGRIKIGQKAFIALDAYPDVAIEGAVSHIAYESEVVNNVTIYDVDILPDTIPDVLRSGMSVTVEVIEKTGEDVTTIPSSAIHYKAERAFVLVRDGSGKIAEHEVTVGLNNDKTAEILSGLSLSDNIITEDSAYLPDKKDPGSNPFMPARRKKK